MTTEPRIAPLPEEEWDDETRALMEALGALNIFGTMAHHPKLLKRWLVFGGHVLAKNTLPPRERELAILRAGWRCDCAYEFGQHTLIGRREGITDAEILRLVEPSMEGWSTGDAAVLAATDQLVADRRIGDDCWEKLAAVWTTQQLMDLVFTVGQYVLTCMALNSFGVVRDPGVPGFPA